jgi:hypothetical protein
MGPCVNLRSLRVIVPSVMCAESSSSAFLNTEVVLMPDALSAGVWNVIVFR